MDIKASRFVYDSFAKSGESVIETQRLSLPLQYWSLWGHSQIAIPSQSGSHFFEQEEQ